MQWYDKRFHSLNYFLKETFGEKIIKVSLNAGLTCPNRDGTLGTDGCIFCSEDGAGDFSPSSTLPLATQFKHYRQKLNGKWPNAKYIAYFQSFTNTYGDLHYLRRIFFEAAHLEGVVGVSIATRPDCLQKEVLQLLKDLCRITFVFVELGFQTSKKSSVDLIHRCYENHIYTDAVKKLQSLGIHVVTHVILGLPWETKEDMLNTVRFACACHTDGIKLHLLYVTKNSQILSLLYENPFALLTFEEYIDIVISCIEIVPPSVVIHRLTGDAPKHLLVAPLYSADKRKILNTIDLLLTKNDTWQGKFSSCEDS